MTLAEPAFPGSTPAQVLAAKRRASVPNVGVTDAEFRSLDALTRAARASAMIRSTWREDCQPLNVLRSRDGEAWDVKCKGTELPRDYSLALPNDRGGSALVLQCYQKAERVSSCSVLGRP